MLQERNNFRFTLECSLLMKPFYLGRYPVVSIVATKNELISIFTSISWYVCIVKGTYVLHPTWPQNVEESKPFFCTVCFTNSKQNLTLAGRFPNHIYSHHHWILLTYIISSSYVFVISILFSFFLSTFFVVLNLYLFLLTRWHWKNLYNIFKVTLVVTLMNEKLVRNTSKFNFSL